MEQAAIQRFDLAGDTLVSAAVSSPSKYEQRKVEGVCTRCGKAAPSDDSNMCKRCQGLVLKAKRRSDNAKRKRLRKAGMCAMCGRKSNRYRCGKCRVSHYLRRAKPPLPKHENEVGAKSGADHSGDLHRTTRSVDSADGYARSRYHGQMQRGRQTIAALDDQDLVSAIKTMIKARRALVIAREAENLNLPRVQREDAANTALAYVDHVRRFLVDVLERSHYEIVESDDNTRG